MVKLLIRDDLSFTYALESRAIIDFARENAGNRKILIFSHVVIFYIQNLTEKKHISNIETGMVRATHQERSQAIGSLHADNLPKQVCDTLYE